MNIDALAIALDAVVAHHDVLRSQFRKHQGIWEQFYSGAAKSPRLRLEDFSSYPPHEQRSALQAVVEEHGLFNLAHPPMLDVLYAENLAEYGNVLFLFGHHLVVDGVSWRIIIEDLEQAYHQAAEAKPVSLAPKTSSYRQWTTTLETLAHSLEIEKDILFWKETLSSPVAPLHLDYEALPGSNTVDSLVVESSRMSSHEAIALLKEATATHHAGVQEILLAALLKTLSDWSGSHHWLIDLEGHGREDVGHGLDLSRTVGWFTSLYPVLLKQPGWNASQETLLKEVKKQMRAIPHHGISFGLLRYLGQDKAVRETLAIASNAQISFNYLGQSDRQQTSDNLFSLSNASTGTGMFAKQERPHLLAINARIQGECLQVDWSYSKHIHRTQTIRHLAESYLNNIRSYLAGSTPTQASFYSATDFRQVDLTESELDSILEDLEDS